MRRRVVDVAYSDRDRIDNCEECKTRLPKKI
jgi:hypothetical protein